MIEPLALSLFPGIGLLDMAFEQEGFCVVRGPDLLWGGDIRRFHPPAGRFDGVIGGPPCQRFSRLSNIVRAVHGEDSIAEDLIPEFVRVVSEARPAWFLMENVPEAPEPLISGYAQTRRLHNNRDAGGVQNRERMFTFGWQPYIHARTAVFDIDFSPCPMAWEPAVCGSGGGRRASVRLGGSGKPKGNQGHLIRHLLRKRSVEEELELQGLPRDYFAGAVEPLLSRDGMRKAIGNGVPLMLGRAVARAVKRAIGMDRGEKVTDSPTPPESTPAKDGE